MNSKMFTTPRPRPQFANSSTLGLDFDQKPISSISSSTTTTPSTSASKSISTPNITSIIDGTSTFVADQNYFDEISSMIDNSHLDTPQTCRLGSAPHLLRIPKQGIGSAGCGSIHSVVSQTNCPIDNSSKILLAKEQHSGVKEHQISGAHSTGTVGGAAMMNIFSSPRSFACTLSSTRSTSAPYTPTVVDECSPPCSLPAPPGSDPFTISGFGPESRSTDPMSGDFSAPLLNYLNDGLNSNSWGGFLPYSKITDYCFENSPDSNILNSNSNSNSSSGCGSNNNNSGSNVNNSSNNGNININSHAHNHNSNHGGSATTSTPSSVIGGNINTSKWGGSVLSKPNCVATPGSGNKTASSSSPPALLLSPSSLSSKANELLDSILMGIIKENGHAGNVFEQASQLINSTAVLLTTRFNKELPSLQPLSNNNPVAPSNSPNTSTGGGNWSPTTLGVGGPNFAAPTMLAHPDEFKNPSSFLKIYGDPLCGKQPSNGNPNPPSLGNMGAQPHDYPAGNVGAGFPNVNPMKGQNGNWACCKCSNVNFPRRFRCFKCGEYRDEVGDKIVAEYAKHVYLHHLKAYRSFNNGNTSVNSGSGSNSGPQSALSLGSGRTGVSMSIPSSFNESLQPVFIQRSNSNNGFIATTPPSNMNYIDSNGANNGSKQQCNSICADGINNNSSSSTCSTSPSTSVSPVGSGSMACQTTKKSSKILTVGL
ncbi:little finger domain-containing protein [Cryptosporidium ubiquitum]|uniref:Little finger domain-containing protein n=1 Tax=Cryptosporidium ubiquitum TaxID=857276 RepID=A0A1J4MRA5_9CRYT|nr:little finger domain-containing protein [Cryptosporidium ubiquitum]OII75429.1 little finger domain-containing protein [Cryptosporidium ubiquitum]